MLAVSLSLSSSLRMLQSPLLRTREIAKCLAVPTQSVMMAASIKIGEFMRISKLNPLVQWLLAHLDYKLRHLQNYWSPSHIGGIMSYIDVEQGCLEWACFYKILIGTIGCRKKSCVKRWFWISHTYHGF